MYKHNSLMIVHIVPSILDEMQRSLIEQELLFLPSQKIENIQINDEFFEILKYISENNINNTLVTFSKIGKKFSIVRATTNKRLRILENLGLILIIKRGRNKTLHVTEKGKILINKRSAI